MLLDSLHEALDSAVFPSVGCIDVRSRTEAMGGLLGSAHCALVVLADTQPQLFAFVHETRHGDKLGHFFLMGGLSLAVNLAYAAAPFRPGGRWLLKGTVIVSAVVTLEELSQLFIPARTFSFLDLLADYAGILVFAEVARWVHHRGLEARGR